MSSSQIAPTPPAGSIAAPRVLVADDDEGSLDVMVRALTRLGLEVVACQDGVELVEAVTHRGPFDLVVTDVVMPWLDGAGFAHLVRRAGLRMPIILVTAHKPAALASTLASLGDLVLLRKPLALDQLAARVLAALAPR